DATATASLDPRTGALVEASCYRLLCIPRSANQHLVTRHVPFSDHRPLAPLAKAAQSEGRHDMETDHEDDECLSPQGPHPSSVAPRALRRQVPEVGAECPNGARSVLCGGRSVMSVPTAISEMSRQIIPLKDRADSQDPSRIPAMETTRV